jgi:DNA repair protein RadA
MSEEKIMEENVVEENVVEENTSEDIKEEQFGIADLPGVGPATVDKLGDAGFDSLLSVAVASPSKLGEASGVSGAVARKIIQVARDKLNMGFETGLDLLKKREQVIKVTTGSSNFNTLVGGGFESGSITECYGAYGSGKTALAHQLAVSAQMPREEGGAGGAVVWIDTEGTFRPERIQQLAEENNLNGEELLANIRVVRAFNSDHQMLLAEKVEELINKENVPVKIVIVDSLMSHFRSEFIGRGTLSERQQKLNKHMHVLLNLAHTYNIVVYVTNQVMSKPDTFFGDPTEAIGGHIVAHASTTRLYLRRGKKGSRVAKLVDAPALADGECVFHITDKGIRDDV